MSALPVPISVIGGVGRALISLNAAESYYALLSPTQKAAVQAIVSVPALVRKARENYNAWRNAVEMDKPVAASDAAWDTFLREWGAKVNADNALADRVVKDIDRGIALAAGSGLIPVSMIPMLKPALGLSGLGAGPVGIAVGVGVVLFVAGYVAVQTIPLIGELAASLTQTATFAAANAVRIRQGQTPVVNPTRPAVFTSQLGSFGVMGLLVAGAGLFLLSKRRAA